jgi:serine/threonine protein phosphatase PrpC
MPRILSFGKSDVGLKRSNNEDSFIMRPDLGFLALADGMGGAAAGEVASQIFVDTAMDVFSRNAKAVEQEPLEIIEEAFQIGRASCRERV